MYFLGARGTGETGPGSSGWDSKKDPYRGFGQTVYDLKTDLATALGRGSVTAVPVIYNSNDVWTLLTNTKKYFADLTAGVNWTLKTLTGQAAKCGHQKIVLAGFSQGAMVMHRVLRKLQATTAGRAILARVAGVILVGDGDQVPDDVGVTRYGSARASAEGVGLAFTKLGSGSSAAKFAASVGRRVLSVCTADDPVCDWKGSDICPPTAASCLLKWHHLVGIHLGYPKGILLAQASGRVVSDILGVGHWTTMTAPLPAGANATGSELSAIACTTSCVAIGGYSDQSGGFDPMLLAGSGKAWTAVAAPLPPNASYPVLRMLACAAPTSCAVVGNYNDGSNGLAGLLITRSGTAWSATKAPMPKNTAPNSQVSFTGVTCPAVGDCVAVGYYVNSADNAEGFVVTWSGSAWKATAIPPPPGGNPSELESVACATPTACVAVGVDNATPGGRGFLATGAGSRWRVAYPPLPKNARPSRDSDVQSVTCPSASTCVAAGWYQDSNGVGQVMLLTHSGKSWTAAEAPPAADNAQFYQLDRVSCTAPNNCMLDGIYQAADYEVATITGHGSSWTTTTVALPPDAEPGALGPGLGFISGAACASASLCAVVGGYADMSNTGEALLVAGAGMAWASMPATLPPGGLPGGDTSLSAITCPTRTGCVAVGQYTDATSAEHAMILTGPQR